VDVNILFMLEISVADLSSNLSRMSQISTVKSSVLCNLAVSASLSALVCVCVWMCVCVDVCGCVA